MEKTFEAKLVKLQELVKQLENNELSLDQSVKIYEECMRLSKELEEELANAKSRIKIVDEDGNEEDFE